MSAPPLRARLAIALSVGALAWFLLAVKFRAGGPYLWALDFTPHWRAADALRRGYSPYEVINGFSTLYLFGAGYLHPLPAAVMLLPFGYLEPQTAAALFTGVSVGVFAFALTRDGYWRLPILGSAPLMYSLLSGQSVPLVTAAMIIPSLGFLGLIKFTTGVAGGAYTLSWRYVAIASGVLLVSIVIWPWWPAQFWAERRDIAASYYHVPIFVGVGCLSLLALIRWRRPEARLLAALACLPQTMFYYDQLPLMLIASSYREALLFTAWSWLPVFLIPVLHHGVTSYERSQLFAWNAPLIVTFYFLPALVIVLRRPNVGELTGLPRFLRRGLEHSPA